MPFNEALFWFGITSFGTGLYFLVEGNGKRLYSIGTTVIGALGCAYSVYHHDHPNSPPIPLWILLLILTWILLGYDIHSRRSRTPIKIPEMPRGTNRQELEVKTPAARAVGISPEQVEQIKLAGVLESKAGHADWLADELEKVWMDYTNQDKKLLSPLGERTLPDPVKEWHEKRLWEFRVQYRTYVNAVRSHLPPNFQDTITGPKSPFRPIAYLDLRKQLKEHANRLRQLAQSLPGTDVSVIGSLEFAPLAPLQKDAMKLSAELLAFLNRLGPPPDPRYTAKEIENMPSSRMKELITAEDGDFAEACEYYQGDGMFFAQTTNVYTNKTTARWTRLLPWYQKFAASYALDFKEPVERMRNRFVLKPSQLTSCCSPLKAGMEKNMCARSPQPYGNWRTRLVRREYWKNGLANQVRSSIFLIQ